MGKTENLTSLGIATTDFISARLRSLAIAIVLFVTTITANAQEFTIKTVEVTPDNIIIYYDLIDTVKARTYSINLYSSKDNFLAPMLKVTGDVGLEVRPGANKKITWSAKEELTGTFKGELELEVRGRVYVPFIKFTDFNEGHVIKRGKPSTLIWTGGTRQNILNFAIYKKATDGGQDTYVTVIPNISNVGHHDFLLPTDIKTGKDYYFRVYDNKNKDQVMHSPLFEIKPKIPLALKAVPILAVGAIVTLIILNKDDGPENIDPPPDHPL